VFARLWQAEVGNVPEFSISTFHSVTGFLQPIRRRLPMHVRPKGPESGRGAAGKRVAFVAALVMSRICDRVLSHRRSTAYAQHAARPPREVS
jgi:hypothetical protein